MKIVVADELPSSAVDLLAAEPGWTIDARPGRSAALLSDDVAEAHALIVRSRTRVDAALLGHAPLLRIVARAGTGVDNVDVDTATSRGVLVVNAPGANSISVAEHTCALLLALARQIPSADRAMKDERWEKNRLLGSELRGKTLGVLGFGRIGQEVAVRARAFGMRIVTHDPFISKDIAAGAGVELMPLDAVCAAADYLTLHLPSTETTTHILNDAQLAKCKPGIRIVNTARGGLIDEPALARALDRGTVSGVALDVFEVEPPRDWSLAKLPQVIATPHIAGATAEAQELVGLETAAAVRDYLRDGIVRNAVNFPSLGADEMQRLQPWIRLADRLGAIASKIGAGRIDRIGLRCYGALADGRALDVLSAGAAAGILGPILSGGVSLVNARAVARARGIDVVESRSSRAQPYTSLLSLRVHSDSGECRIEGTVFEPNSLRLVSIQGVAVEAPLAGTIIVITNEDRPGVIGDVGTILGRHGVNIANFALGRQEGGAVGVVNVDETSGLRLDAALADLRGAAGVRGVWVVT